MQKTTRRDFVRHSMATGLAVAPAIRPGWGAQSPNETINIGIVGIHGRGRDHYRAFGSIPGVRIAYLCDIDERLFPGAVDEVEKINGNRPETIVDFRELIQRDDVDAVTVATPDHWHALMTVWACQAGKDVYCEKPASYTLAEGRKMVQAARKYNRIVQVGLNRRSTPRTRSAIRYIQDEGLGPIYRAKAVIYRERLSIGTVQESSIPEGVHWDLFLGPAPYTAFTENRFHYGWHFFWDTSTTEVGNNGVHYLDLVRWGLQKNEHPVKVQCMGGLYVDEGELNVPNVLVGALQYADGTQVEIESTNLPSPAFDGMRMGAVWYTPRGYVSTARNWSTGIGEITPANRPDPAEGVSNRINNLSFPRTNYVDGPEIPDIDEPRVSHFENFINAMRSRNRDELYCEVEQGHLSTSLCHLSNIAFKTGRTLTFDPDTETFPGDAEANLLLTRTYRAPFVMPEEV